MKYRIFTIFGVIVLAAFAGFVYLAWPYRGLIPLVSKPPVDLAEVIPETPTTSQPTVAGKNDTGIPLKLPTGFSINIFAKGLGVPRVLELDPDGNLVASLMNQGKIVALPDQNQDGKADSVKTIVDHLNQPHGIAFNCIQNSETCLLYTAETNALASYEYNPQTFEVGARNKLLDIPTGGRHTTRTLLLEPNTNPQRLLLSIGSSCDQCHETNAQRGSVQSVNLDGSDEKPFATGLRNAVFMTDGPDGQVWATEMGHDYLGDDVPPDEVNILQDGKNYGWPNCYGQDVHDTSFDKNTYIRNPCMEPFELPSKIDIQAHSAPLGLAFVPKNAGWPKEYEGNLLVAYHGSWDRTVPTGYKIHRFVFDDKGNVVHDEDFVTGWLTAKGDVLGRPVGLKFGTDGALYVSDDKAGVVYRITPPIR